jgi:hypothetical protein
MILNRGWFFVLMLPFVSFAVYAKSTLSCDADKGGVSHSLTIAEKDGGAPDFSYLSSTPSQSLALNCTIDSSLVTGVPRVSGNVVTYPLSGGDSLSIIKQSRGYVLDMSKLDAASYCSGVVAKKVTITNGKNKCKVQ